VALFGLVDLTIVFALLYVWMLNKWGKDATQAYRALLIALYAVAAIHSFGFRL